MRNKSASLFNILFSKNSRKNLKKVYICIIENLKNVLYKAG